MSNQRQSSGQAIQWGSCAECVVVGYFGVDRGCAYVGVAQGVSDWELPQITSKKSDWPTEIRNSGKKEMATGGVKERIARLFNKAFFATYFSS